MTDRQPLLDEIEQHLDRMNQRHRCMGLPEIDAARTVRYPERLFTIQCIVDSLHKDAADGHVNDLMIVSLAAHALAFLASERELRADLLVMPPRHIAEIVERAA